MACGVRKYSEIADVMLLHPYTVAQHGSAAFAIDLLICKWNDTRASQSLVHENLACMSSGFGTFQRSGCCRKTQASLRTHCCFRYERACKNLYSENVLFYLFLISGTGPGQTIRDLQKTQAKVYSNLKEGKLPAEAAISTIQEDIRTRRINGFR